MMGVVADDRAERAGVKFGQAIRLIVEGIAIIDGTTVEEAMDDIVSGYVATRVMNEAGVEEGEPPK